MGVFILSTHGTPFWAVEESRRIEKDTHKLDDWRSPIWSFHDVSRARDQLTRTQRLMGIAENERLADGQHRAKLYTPVCPLTID